MPQALDITQFPIVDPNLSFTPYVDRANATVNDGNTIEIQTQTPSLFPISFAQRQIEFQLTSLSQTQAEEIFNHVDTSKLNVLQGTAEFYDMSLGAYILPYAIATAYQPAAPFYINGVAFYPEGVTLTYSSSRYQ